MSHFLERLTYLTRRRETFADGLCELRDEDRMWEEGYRQRWQHLPDLLDALAERLLWRLVLGHVDKIVRSTHGVNCTGGSSWRVVSNIKWCAAGWSRHGARRARPWHRSKNSSRPQKKSASSTLTPSYILLSGREASMLAKHDILELEAR